MGKHKFHLLLIDDSPEDQELLRSHLCSADDCEFDFTIAEDGVEALVKFKARDFDCVLLDYRLPDTDGIRLLAEFRQIAGHDLPIVFVTGQGNEKLAVRALREGAADYIVKSHLSSESLYRAVINAIEKHQSAKKLEREHAKFLEAQKAKIESQELALAAHEDLLRERKRLSDFFTQIPAPIAILKGHKLVFEFVNEPMRVLIGIHDDGDADHLSKLTDYFGREVTDIVRLVYKSGKRFTANEFEIERAWKDGDSPRTKYFNVNFEPLRDDDGSVTGVIFMMTEITSLVESRHLIEASEQRARDSELRFKKIAEIIPDMIWVVDTEGRGEYFNAAWSQFTTGRSDRRSNDWLQFVHPDDRGKILRALRDGGSPEGTFESSFRLRAAATGDYRYQLARGMPMREEDGSISKWYIASSDVHDERILTKNLRESEQRLQLATTASQVGIWEVDLETRAYWSNPEHDKAFGHVERVTDWSIERILAQVMTEDRARLKAVLEQGLITHKPFTAEFRILWPNQTLHWLQISGGVDESSEGKPRMAGTVIDITDRKFREQDLKDAKNIAIAANETKTAFLANMSHEIRTPLNAIIGFTDLIAGSDISNEERSKFAETVQRNGRALMQIIDDILDLSKIEANKLEMNFERVDLVQLLDDIQLLFVPTAAEKHLEFSVRIEPDVQNIILTDPIRIRQILMNAVSNALKFTLEGSVVLTVHRAQSTGIQPWLCFSIRDTGIGISEENQSRLFQSFSQADNSMTRKFGGTGLGLMLSRRLAKLLGGSFYLARSRVGEGSTFELRLPEKLVSQQLGVEPENAPKKVPEFLQGLTEADIAGVQILLVDDSPDGRLLAKRYLSKKGASVEDASSAQEAIELISGNDFDLVITDVQMPEMDGHSLTRELRRRGVSVPIIGLSAHVFAEDRQRSLDSGMNDHLGKPVKQAELVSTVARWVKR